MNTKASELREDIRGELIEMLETIRNSGITRLSKRHKEHIDLCTEELYHIFITYTADAVKEARIEGALFALDNETLWQYQRKCNAGEASKATRRWLVNLLEANIERYKAALTNQEQQGGKVE